jgi:hypothetical protein
VAYAGRVIIYSDSSWPLWARIAITVFSVGLFGVLAWRYYLHFWRR